MRLGLHSALFADVHAVLSVLLSVHVLPSAAVLGLLGGWAGRPLAAADEFAALSVI